MPGLSVRGKGAESGTRLRAGVCKELDWPGGGYAGMAGERDWRRLFGQFAVDQADH